MKVIVLSVGGEPEIKDQPKISLEDLQRGVSEDGGRGTVTCPYIPGLNEAGVTLWANDDGLCLNMAPSLLIDQPDFFEPMVIVGPVVFTSSDKNGNTKGLNKKQLAYVQEWIGKSRFTHDAYVNAIASKR